MAQQFFNNANTAQLRYTISPGVTSFDVNPGEGALFPLDSNNHFYVTIGSEVVKVTNRSTDTFTCEETGSAHTSGDPVAQYVTAEMMNDMAQAIGDGQVLSGHELTDYVESIASQTTTSSTLTLDLSKPYHVVTLAHSITSITFTNLPPSGKAASYTVEFIQDSSGGKTIAFPSSFKTAGGSGITIGSTANAVSIVVFMTRDGGTVYRSGLFGASFT